MYILCKILQGKLKSRLLMLGTTTEPSISHLQGINQLIEVDKVNLLFPHAFSSNLV